MIRSAGWAEFLVSPCLSAGGGGDASGDRRCLVLLREVLTGYAVNGGQPGGSSCLLTVRADWHRRVLSGPHDLNRVGPAPHDPAVQFLLSRRCLGAARDLQECAAPVVSLHEREVGVDLSLLTWLKSPIPCSRIRNRNLYGAPARRPQLADQGQRNGLIVHGGPPDYVDHGVEDHQRRYPSGARRAESDRGADIVHDEVKAIEVQRVYGVRAKMPRLVQL